MPEVEGPLDPAQRDAAGHVVWQALRKLEGPILERLGPHGIIGVYPVVGFVHPFEIHLWLATATDAARDALPSPDPFLDEVRAVVAASRFPHEHATIIGTVAQSQETVDREYEGSWWYARR